MKQESNITKPLLWSCATTEKITTTKTFSVFKTLQDFSGCERCGVGCGMAIPKRK
jgi:hypothetical protein